MRQAPPRRADGTLRYRPGAHGAHQWYPWGMRRVLSVLLVVFVAGCNQILGIGDLGPANESIDAANDAASADGAPADAVLADAPLPCSLWKYAPSNIACDNTSGQDWTITDNPTTFDTDSGTQTSGTWPTSTTIPQGSGGPDIRLVVVDSFRITAAAKLVVRGSHPLVILVHGDASIAGVLDGSGVTTGAGGGGDNPACGSRTGGNGVGGLGGGTGGGGGGALAAPGGKGGNGIDWPGGAAGVAASGTSLVPLIGGCAGGDGGSDGGLRGHGGAGGGSIQISARDTIVIGANGSILLDGGEGSGGQYSGGGAGGSGGAALLEAPSIGVAGATISANGGRGATGGGGAGGAGGGGGAGGSANTPGGSNGGAGGAPHASGGGAGGSVGAITVFPVGRLTLPGTGNPLGIG